MDDVVTAGGLGARVEKVISLFALLSGCADFFPSFFVFAGTLFLRFVEIPGRFEVVVEISCRGLNDL